MESLKNTEFEQMTGNLKMLQDTCLEESAQASLLRAAEKGLLMVGKVQDDPDNLLQQVISWII